MTQFASDAGPSDLAILAYQVRECTLRLLDDTEPGALTWTPPGTVNHILWHAGHAVWVADVLTIEPITGHSELPGGWAEKFGQHRQRLRSGLSAPKFVRDSNRSSSTSWICSMCTAR